MHQATSQKSSNGADHASGPSSVAPSIDNVVIPHGHIMNDWLKGIGADVQDNGPGANENAAPSRRLTQHHHKMTRRMKH